MEEDVAKRGTRQVGMGQSRPKPRMNERSPTNPCANPRTLHPKQPSQPKPSHPSQRGPRVLRNLPTSPPRLKGARMQRRMDRKPRRAKPSPPRPNPRGPRLQRCKHRKLLCRMKSSHPKLGRSQQLKLMCRPTPGPPRPGGPQDNALEAAVAAEGPEKRGKRAKASQPDAGTEAQPTKRTKAAKDHASEAPVESVPEADPPNSKRQQKALGSEPKRSRKNDAEEPNKSIRGTVAATDCKKAARKAIRDGLDMPGYCFVDIDFYWSRNAMGVKLRNCWSIEDRGKQAPQRQQNETTSFLGSNCKNSQIVISIYSYLCIDLSRSIFLSLSLSLARFLSCPFWDTLFVATYSLSLSLSLSVYVCIYIYIYIYTYIHIHTHRDMCL